MLNWDRIIDISAEQSGNPTMKCHELQLRFLPKAYLYIHWHAGGIEDGFPIRPYFRLRHLSIVKAVPDKKWEKVHKYIWDLRKFCHVV